MFNFLKIKTLNIYEYILSLSFITILFYGLPIYRRYSSHNIMIIILVFIFSFLVVNFFYSIVTTKKTYRIVIPSFLVLNSVVFHFMLIYGVSFDANMMINTTETNFNEAIEFINFRLFFDVVVFGFLPALLFYKFIRIEDKKFVKHKLILIAISIVIALLMITPNYLYKSGKEFLKANQRITSYIVPVNYVESIFEFSGLKIKNYYDAKHLIDISSDAYYDGKIGNNGKKNLIIFVLGESARARNFSLNGYERNTNVPLEKYKDDIISFKNFEACGTFTVVSLTCTFSHLPRKEFDYAKSFKYQSLIDILDHAGYDVYWRSNNGKCKNVCNRVKNSLVKSFGDNIYDDLLVKAFKMDLDRMTKQNNFVVLHGRGSHGPLYYNRYSDDFEIYKPACKDNLENCSTEEIINAYDNSVYYTSYTIKEVIQEAQRKSKDFNIILIFMSDHGESLGENGVFMHSAEFDIAPIDQKNSEFFIWLSKDAEKSFNISKECLKKKMNDNISQDNIFHSVIGLSGIKSVFYDEKLDIFKDCRIK